MKRRGRPRSTAPKGQEAMKAYERAKALYAAGNFEDARKETLLPTDRSFLEKRYANK